MVDEVESLLRMIVHFLACSNVQIPTELITLYDIMIVRVVSEHDMKQLVVMYLIHHIVKK